MRLREDAVAQVGRQTILSQDIDIDPQDVLKLLGKSDQIEKITALSHLDQGVEGFNDLRSVLGTS